VFLIKHSVGLSDQSKRKTRKKLTFIFSLASIQFTSPSREIELTTLGGDGAAIVTSHLKGKVLEPFHGGRATCWRSEGHGPKARKNGGDEKKE